MINFRYYNREAVVISALQVEKHPITTPGPLTMSPSVTRLQKGAVGVYSALQFAKGVSGSTHGSSHLTPLTGTPHGEYTMGILYYYLSNIIDYFINICLLHLSNWNCVYNFIICFHSLFYCIESGRNTLHDAKQGLLLHFCNLLEKDLLHD